ncbi:MAG TPA: hypothetical protein VJX67_17290, partial [Blastocatellia bacterium]|nr:hypothetical protein [Blastocatellia bacterium]
MKQQELEEQAGLFRAEQTGADLRLHFRMDLAAVFHQDFDSQSRNEDDVRVPAVIESNELEPEADRRVPGHCMGRRVE